MKLLGSLPWFLKTFGIAEFEIARFTAQNMGLDAIGVRDFSRGKNLIAEGLPVMADLLSLILPA